MTLLQRCIYKVLELLQKRKYLLVKTNIGAFLYHLSKSILSKKGNQPNSFQRCITVKQLHWRSPNFFRNRQTVTQLRVNIQYTRITPSRIVQVCKQKFQIKFFVMKHNLLQKQIYLIILLEFRIASLISADICTVTFSASANLISCFCKRFLPKS